MTDRPDSMLIVKAMVVIPGCEISERVWRERRARSLARIIAWGRRYPDNDGIRQTTENIINDIGMPNRRWLDRQVVEEGARIKADLAEWDTLTTNEAPPVGQDTGE